MRYQNTFIWVMQFEYCFQYLFPYGSDIYQNHIFFLPVLWKRILYRLGLMKTIYSKEQLEVGEKIVLSGAMETLDKLNDPNVRAEHRKAKKQFKKKMKEQKDCVWQAQEMQEGMYYAFLTHKEIIKMEDGVQPTHK